MNRGMLGPDFEAIVSFCDCLWSKKYSGWVERFQVKEISIYPTMTLIGHLRVLEFQEHGQR